MANDGEEIMVHKDVIRVNPSMLVIKRAPVTALLSAQALLSAPGMMQCLATKW